MARASYGLNEWSSVIIALVFIGASLVGLVICVSTIAESIGFEVYVMWRRLSRNVRTLFLGSLALLFAALGFADSDPSAERWFKQHTQMAKEYTAAMDAYFSPSTSTAIKGLEWYVSVAVRAEMSVTDETLRRARIEERGLMLGRLGLTYERANNLPKASEFFDRARAAISSTFNKEITVEDLKRIIARFDQLYLEQR